jgi:hypothetical protein
MVGSRRIKVLVAWAMKIGGSIHLDSRATVWSTFLLRPTFFVISIGRALTALEHV